MAVRMWPVLPKDNDQNGLGSIEKPMLDDGDAEFYLVAKVCRRRYTFDDHAKEMTPQAEVLRIEHATGDHEATVARILDELLLKRTNAGTLDEHFDGDE